MSDVTNNSGSADAEARGHEFTPIKVGPVVFGGVVLFGILVVSMFAMSGLFRGLETMDDRDTLPPMAAPRQIPPAPRLVTDEATQITAHRSQVEAQLSEYGWVDEEEGIVRIPLERAMELVAERGLPTSEDDE